MTPSKRWRIGFNRLSGSYDLLTKLVFWGALQRAQRRGAEQLPKKGRWLVLGGGTGHSAAEMKRLGIGEEIVFLDISDKMVAKAQKRVEAVTGKEGQQWKWIVGDALKELPKGPFQGVVLHFFLDLFPEAELPRVIHQIQRQLAPDGCIWVADFRVPKAGIRRYYARGLTAVMYAFFRFCCGINGKNLPDIPKILAENGMKQVSVHHYYASIVFSGVWKIAQG